MTKQELAEIKARCDAATPGSWEADYNHPFSNDFVGIYNDAYGYIVKAEDEDEGYSTSSADADFIAHARTDIPALLAEVERLQADYEALKASQPVKCIGCVYWENDGKHITGLCVNKNIGKLKLDTDFCSYGERQDAE